MINGDVNISDVKKEVDIDLTLKREVGELRGLILKVNSSYKFILFPKTSSFS